MASIFPKKIEGKLFGVILLSLLSFTTSCIVHVQAEPGIEWETLVGDPSNFHWGTGVDQTSDGGYIITGYVDTSGTSAAGFYKIYLAKISQTGRKEWSKSIGDASKESSGLFVQQTSDGGYIIAGTIDQMGWGTPTSVYLVKTDSQGNTAWAKTYGEAIANGNSVYQTKDGGYIFAAGSRLIKTDSNGNEQWSKNYSNDVQHAHQTTDEGYILVTGSQAIKLNKTGLDIWSCDVGIIPKSVQETSDGGCVVIGGGVSLGKVDSSGVLNWTRSFSGGSQYNEGSSVQQTYDGGYIVVGTTRSDDNIDVYVIRTDGNGVLRWEKRIGSTGIGRGDYGHHVELCDDGGYIVVGASDKAGLNGVSDVYLIKIGSDTVPSVDPAEFILYDLSITPDSVEMGQDVSISVRIENIGDETGSLAVVFRVDDDVVLNQSVTLDGGELSTVDFVSSYDVNGTYTVNVNGLLDSFRVRGPGEPFVPPEPEPEPAPIPEPEPEVEKILTSIVFHIAKEKMDVNEISTFSGYITPAIFGASIEIRSILDETGPDTEDSIYVTTMLDGSFSGEISFPRKGYWEVWVFWSGNSEYESARASQYVKIGTGFPNIPSFPLSSIIFSLTLIILWSRLSGYYR